eukprot:1158480-Pelagomonas_calceolata.AAC.6
MPRRPHLFQLSCALWARQRPLQPECTSSGRLLGSSRREQQLVKDWLSDAVCFDAQEQDAILDLLGSGTGFLINFPKSRPMLASNLQPPSDTLLSKKIKSFTVPTEKEFSNSSSITHRFQRVKLQSSNLPEKWPGDSTKKANGAANISCSKLKTLFYLSLLDTFGFRAGAEQDPLLRAIPLEPSYRHKLLKHLVAIAEEQGQGLSEQLCEQMCAQLMQPKVCGPQTCRPGMHVCNGSCRRVRAGAGPSAA